MESLRVRQKPNSVPYKDLRTNEIKWLVRRPAKIEHEMLPTDKVELLERKSDDFVENEIYDIKSINTRNPNIIQIEKEDGLTTFIPSYELNLNEKVAERPGDAGKNILDNLEDNRYLRWP